VYLFVVVKLQVLFTVTSVRMMLQVRVISTFLLQENRNTVRSIESVYAPTRKSRTKRVFMLVAV